MKREEIKGILPEITQEQLDQIMAINGTDIQQAKGKLEQAQLSVDDLQAKLTAANEQIEQFKAGGEELERLRGVEEELTALKAANVIREIREKVSTATGVPASMLTFDNEEDCTKQANSIKEFAKPSSYPKLRDGGEPGTPKPDTAHQFAEWFNQIAK